MTNLKTTTHAGYKHFCIIGSPADAFYTTHELIKDIGKVYGIPGTKNPFLKTEEMLERVTHEPARKSALKRVMKFEHSKILKDGLLDMKMQKLKRRIRSY